MTHVEKMFTPSRPLEPGDRYGVLSGFDPGTRTLPAGFRLAPAFKSLPVDIVLDKDVRVTMRDGVTTYVDILRPAGTEKVPVIVRVEPVRQGQGKRSGRDRGIWAGRFGQRDRVGSAQVRGTRPGVLVRPAATRSATPMSEASQIRRATAFYGIAKKAGTAMI